VDLPAPDTEGFIPLETAMASRRSVRSYGPEALSDAELGQLCWSAQGITEEGGRFRAAPSAGALYPLEVYVATDQALYHYSPEDHALGLVRGEDVRLDLQAAALGQEHVGQAPAVFIMTGVVSRLEVKYGDRSWQYMLLEAGHAAQNLLLQATTLELGACPVGAFEDDGLAGILGLDDGEAPLYLITVGTLG
jgi:SagB-type dehydrogenase family enzyme